MLRIHADAVDLYDANVNGWLARTDRRFLIRVLRGGNGSGVVRAVLSDKYSRIDHLDVLMAALDGIRGSGVPVVIDGADLSERRMSVRVYSPDVQAMAPQLLAGYRSPFDGRPGADLPVVWGGFLISNSETGFGAFTIAPRLHVQVCSNGLVMNASALHRTHLGSAHDGGDGVVTWSEANADIPGLELRRSFHPAAEAFAPISRAADLGEISASSAHQLIRLAWTLADLAGEARPGAQECGLALAFHLGVAR